MPTADRLNRQNQRIALADQLERHTGRLSIGGDELAELLGAAGAVLDQVLTPGDVAERARRKAVADAAATQERQRTERQQLARKHAAERRRGKQ